MNSAKSKDTLFNEQRLNIDFNCLNIRNAKWLGRLNYAKAHDPLEMHVHKDTFEICYIAKGRQTYVVDGKEYHITGGDVYVTHPNELHGSGTNPEEKSILYWLLIDVGDTRRFLDYPEEEGKELLTGLLGIKKRCFRGNTGLKEFLDRIFLAYYMKKPFGKILIRNLLAEFLINIIKLEKEDRDHSFSFEINTALKLIEADTAGELELAELAYKTNLSVSRFKQKFKEEVGIPPNEYIIRKKVERAHELLENTGINITDIAYRLNFSSSQYFSTVYRKITGKSPTESRR